MDACLAAFPSALSLHKGRTESVRSLSALLRALSLFVRAEHGGAPLAAIAELVKLHATASLSLSMLNEWHHHLRHAMPRAPHPFPGRDRRWRPLSPGRRRCHRLLSWLCPHRPPWTEPGTPARARRPPGARAALNRRRR
jgi:hypothetical protein